MDVVTGALNALLPKLGDLLMEEYQLQTGVRDDIKFLMAELEKMQTALLKISEAPMDKPPDIQDKLWASEVRELSYDIDDCVDKFMVRVDHEPKKELHGFRDFIDRCLNLVRRFSICHNIGADIKNLKRRIKDVSESRKRYKVDNAYAKPVGPTVDSLRLSALYKKATELVGTEEKSDDIVEMLMEGDKELKVVSIVGFGGLGKTALAKIVYEKLKVQFDCGAFIPISNSPDMEKILKRMLFQLDKNKYSNINGATLDEVELINELRDLLREKRYFIVIDDIWSTSVWKKVQYALTENECGSRIITTTRILDISRQANCVYELKPLSPADSRKLFNLSIFGNDDKCQPNELAEVSEKI